jgi:hypothetical protein
MFIVSDKLLVMVGEILDFQVFLLNKKFNES